MNYREQFNEELKKTRVIAIVRGVEPSYLFSLTQALYDGGIRLMEVTLNTPGATDMIQQNRADFNGKMLVGAGTVLDETGLNRAIDAGAQFIVTPAVDLKILDVCASLDMPISCGAMTPSEILTAYSHGSNPVKLFPAGSLGPQFIKELQGPLSHIPLIAVGGVSLDNAQSLMEVGIYGLGIGGSLIDKTALASGHFSSITDKAAALIKITQRFLGK
jgi:2-dehydro-3-deoxyphosphogluconate aldolase/(4S)-4-hydroxy-2-oxoglutarate aldolase